MLKMNFNNKVLVLDKTIVRQVMRFVIQIVRKYMLNTDVKYNLTDGDV